MTISLENPEIRKGKHGQHDSFEIFVDDTEVPAGFTVYEDIEQDGVKRRIFPHTVVRKEFAGKGLASALIRYGLDQSISEGFRIVPQCSFVDSWAKKHPEYLEHVDQV